MYIKKIQFHIGGNGSTWAGSGSLTVNGEPIFNYPTVTSTIEYDYPVTLKDGDVIEASVRQADGSRPSYLQVITQGYWVNNP